MRIAAASRDRCTLRDDHSNPTFLIVSWREERGEGGRARIRLSGSGTISTDVSTPEKTRLPCKILRARWARDEDRGPSSSSTPSSTSGSSVALESGDPQAGVLHRPRWDANPCENNRLIPNPSPRARGRVRGARIVFEPFRINLAWWLVAARSSD